MEDSKNKILFVDDEDAWRLIFERNLKGIFEVMTAKDADEGWELLKKHAGEIAIIISDQRLPGRPGIELLKQARAYFPRIIRILTTGFTDSTIAIHATNQGAVYHYISKPWNEEELISILKRAMEFYLIRQERDNLMERKLSSIQRKTLESKVQCLLVFGASKDGEMKGATQAFECYLKSVFSDPGRIFDLKSIYKKSKGELSSLSNNINLIKKLMEVPARLSTAKASLPIDSRKILISIRDFYSQVIFSVDNPKGLGKRKLTPEEAVISEYLKDLLSNWMESSGDKKLLEILEKKASPDVPSREDDYHLRVGYFNDPVPYIPAAEQELFNGINLEESKELAWLRFLLAVYHFGGNVTPLFLSNDRLSFQLSGFSDKPVPTIESDHIIADLLKKFHGWNYIENGS
jgi:FixJ family two-component response regulator